jgi:two-component system KDP operon response regulator KdpE
VWLAASVKPDIIICDLGLPDIEGTEVIAKIREWSAVPILVLSVRMEDKDIISALDIGADDYLCKPFNIDVLLARMRVNLRKAVTANNNNGEAASPICQVGDISLDMLRHEVKLKDTVISLSPKEYNLLKYFMTNAGKMLTHKQILQEVWGQAHTHNHQYLRVYVGQLRHKIEPEADSPSYIVTESGIGYRFENPANSH